jgi:hypothetical protein
MVLNQYDSLMPDKASITCQLQYQQIALIYTNSLTFAIFSKTVKKLNR